MIAEAHAAAQKVASVAADLTAADIKELLAWLNALLLPIGAFVLKVERRLARLHTWTQEHDKSDNNRFDADNRRMNDIISRLGDHTPNIATAALREGNAR